MSDTPRNFNRRVWFQQKIQQPQSGSNYTDRYTAWGDTMATNGNFESDTSWTKGTGWTIAGNKATHAASASAANLSQSIVFIAGMTYDIVFRVSAYTAGSLKAIVNGTSGTSRTALGVYVERIVAGSTGGFILQASADFVGSVTLVQVRIARDRWANIRHMGGSGYLRGRQVTEGTTAVVQVRYMPDLNKDAFIWYPGETRRFRVLAITPVDKEYMDLDCNETEYDL